MDDFGVIVWTSFLSNCLDLFLLFVGTLLDQC